MTSCDTLAPSLLAIDDAVARVLAAAEAVHRSRPEPQVELPLWDARGHVLATDVATDRDVPPFDRVAMDGFAFRATDAGPQPLRIVGEVAAGQEYVGTLGPGEAIAVMTGAPLPRGGDTVEMIERCQVVGDTVVIPVPESQGRHIARQGEDLAAGDVAVPAGRLIRGPTTGVLAGVGAARVTVHRPPRVSVFATGSELVSLDETPEPQQIREGNRHTLMNMLAPLRASVVNGGIVADTREAIRDAMRGALDSDAIVLSGGVSKGKYDLVADVLGELGMETLFHGVRVKPGKPALVGRLGDTLVFGLPGNPVSAYVMGVLLLLPGVRALAGRKRPHTRTFAARLMGEFPAAKARTTYHSGDLQNDPTDGPTVRLLRWNGSGDLSGYSAGNCLIRVDPGTGGATHGDQVTVLLCD